MSKNIFLSKLAIVYWTTFRKWASRSWSAAELENFCEYKKLVGVTYFCVASSTLKIHLNIKQGKSYLFPTAKLIDEIIYFKSCVHLFSLGHVLLFLLYERNIDRQKSYSQTLPSFTWSNFNKWNSWARMKIKDSCSIKIVQGLSIVLYDSTIEKWQKKVDVLSLNPPN